MKNKIKSVLLIYFLILISNTFLIQGQETPNYQLNIAYNFTRIYEPWENNEPKLIYPSSKSQSQYQRPFLFQKPKIHITNEDYTQAPNAVVFHEFGHHVMYELMEDMPTCPIDQLRYEVSQIFGNANFCFEYNYDWERAECLLHILDVYHFATTRICPEFAFTEGWAFFFENVVKDDSNTDNYGDTESTDYNYGRNGAEIEGSVASILWDIADDKDSKDSTTDVDDDLVSGEFSKIWTVLKEDKPSDILEFYDVWFTHGINYENYQNELYSIYENNGISNIQNPWSYFCHDQRRTCYSSLKGDIEEDDTDQLGWPGDYGGDADTIVMTNVDRDEQNELFITSVVYDDSLSNATSGYVYRLDYKKTKNKTPEFRFKELVKDVDPTYESGLINDIDGDGKKEYVFITRYGTVYALDAKSGTIKWINNQYNDRSRTFGPVSIANVDLNGTKEIIFTDFAGNPDKQAYLYFINAETGKQAFSKVNIGSAASSTSGGTYFHVSIADLDGNEYPEIVVPNYYGVYIYEWDGDQITEERHNTNAKLTSNVIISDIDRDNSYELVYSTNDYLCYSGKTCEARTYIWNSDAWSEAEIVYTSGLSPKRSMAIADIVESNNVLEIITYLVENPTGNSAKIDCVLPTGGACSGWPTGFYDISVASLNIAPTVADINGDGEKEILVSGDDGRLSIFNSDGTREWFFDFGGQIISEPVIGDWDGDGKAEIAVKHYTGSAQSMWLTANSIEPGTITDAQAKSMGLNPIKRFNPDYLIDESIPEYETVSFVPLDAVATMSVLDGLNKQPFLNEIETQQYFIAGEYLELNASATDENNDSLSYYFSSPLNITDNLGYWQTNSSHDGVYEVLVSASDGNLSDSQYVTINVLREDTQKISEFSDSSESKELSFNNSYMETETLYLNISNQSRIWHADFTFEGQPLEILDESYQEMIPIVIEANEINNSYKSDKLVDGNWSSYYSAGSLTGAIVEIQDLIVPDELGHLIFHLKLRHDINGNGRFGVFNYEKNYYEIITSLIPATNKTEDIYFDIYNQDESALWIGNSTHYSMRVNDIAEYLNSTINASRWYYRYINGNYSNQLIYESEVKLAKKVNYPKNLIVSLDGQVVLNASGNIINDNIKLTSFSDGNSNRSFVLSNSSELVYVKIPKSAEIESAYLYFGNHTTNDINLTSLQLETLKENVYGEVLSSASNINLRYSFPEFIYVNGEKMKFNYSKTPDGFETSDFCTDSNWHADPDQYGIDDVWYGPHCADEYGWHELDVDSDSYSEKYMLVGETYKIWSKCKTYPPYEVTDFEWASSSEGCDDGNCNSNVEESSWSVIKSSTASSISYPSMYCYSDYTGWWGWDSGTHYYYWDANENGEWDSGEHLEYYMVLECGENADCENDEYCNEEGNTNPLDNNCEMPVCSPSCSEWEGETYGNHTCSCALLIGRCDTSEYGWQNVDDNEYCDSNHYPSTQQTINCSIYETWSIVNHTEQCELTEGRCNTSSAQLDWKYYCSEDFWIREIEIFIGINNTPTAFVLKTDITEIDIADDLQAYLEICMPDSQGNCLVPISLSSDYDASFEINSINVDYGIERLDYTDILQSNLLDQCTGICVLPIDVTSSDGIINIQDLRVYRAPQTKPELMFETTLEIYESQTLTINATDADNDLLNILGNMSQFLQDDNTIEWVTNSTDAGIYDIMINASDGLQTDVKSYVLIVKDTIFIDHFSDNTAQKSLQFNETETQTVQLNVSKNAQLINSRFIIQGNTLNGIYPYNVSVYIGSSLVFNESGNLTYSYLINNLNEDIEDSLFSCEFNSNGSCLVNITVTAESGEVNLSGIEIYYIEDNYILTKFIELTSNYNEVLFEVTLENNENSVITDLN